MKPLIARPKLLMMLTLITLSLSYSCSSTALVPKLEVGRTLRIDTDKPQAIYRYCLNYHWLSRNCTSWKLDTYDLTDKAIRQKLSDMGYVIMKRKDLTQ